MRFNPSLVVFGVLLLALYVSQAAPVRRIVPKGKTAWKSKAYRFAVWMPLKPTVTRGKNGSVNTAIFKLRTPTVSYTVVATALTVSSRLRSDRATFVFDTLQQGLLQNPEGRLLAQQELRLGDVPGRAVRMSFMQGQTTSFTRFYYSPRFLYQVSAILATQDIRSQAAQINRVLDSFRILPQ